MRFESVDGFDFRLQSLEKPGVGRAEQVGKLMFHPASKTVKSVTENFKKSSKKFHKNHFCNKIYQSAFRQSVIQTINYFQFNRHNPFGQGCKDRPNVTNIVLVGGKAVVML